MILTDGRTRTLRLVDDIDGTKFNSDGSFAEVDAALTTAQVEVWQLAVGSGINLFNTETTVPTDATGLASLTSLRPIRIVNVALSNSSGQRNGTIKPIRFDQSPVNMAGVQTLKLVYVPRASFPAGPSSAFVWGSSGIDATALFDTLMCCIAASELKIKEGEINAGLEKRKDELRVAVATTLSVPTWTVMPIDNGWRGYNDSGISYVMTAPDQLQLVFGV